MICFSFNLSCLFFDCWRDFLHALRLFVLVVPNTIPLRPTGLWWRFGIESEAKVLDFPGMGTRVDRNGFPDIVLGDTGIVWLCFKSQKKNYCSRTTFKRIDIVLDMMFAYHCDFPGVYVCRLWRAIDPEKF